MFAHCKREINIEIVISKSSQTAKYSYHFLNRYATNEKSGQFSGKEINFKHSCAKSWIEELRSSVAHFLSFHPSVSEFHMKIRSDNEILIERHEKNITAIKTLELFDLDEVTILSKIGIEKSSKPACCVIL